MADRIGLVAFWKNYDRKLYLRAAQLADELGYDSFWVPEAWGYEISTLLTEMALTTKRIKLGTGIFNVYSRSPGLIAMTAATIDEISERPLHPRHRHRAARTSSKASTAASSTSR